MARCVLLTTLYTYKFSGLVEPLYSDTDSIIFGTSKKGADLI